MILKASKKNTDIPQKTAILSSFVAFNASLGFNDEAFIRAITIMVSTPVTVMIKYMIE